MTGPDRLVLVRHGESLANVAATAAERSGALRIVVDDRDADVPLSGTGGEQARAFGMWLRDQSVPTSVWVSPYRRARQTLEIAQDATGRAPLTPRVDDRLRDRELGVLDLLTSAGVDALLPEEAARRRWLGKYYYRPPGGESWADVALRLRSVLADVSTATPEGTALVVAHDAVVTLVVALCTDMDEAALLEFTRTRAVPNASVTILERDGEGWTLASFADVAHLEASPAPVTTHPGDQDPAVH